MAISCPRQCTARLSERRPSGRCALADLGACCSPCDGTVSRVDYLAVTDAVRASLTVDVRPVLAANRRRLARLIAQERFEEAGQITARLEAFVRASTRARRIGALAGCAQIVAACRAEDGWEVHVIRHGRLAAAALARAGEVPQAVARDAVAAAEQVVQPVPGMPAATLEETQRIAAWLERPGVRLMDVDGEWSWPLYGSIAVEDLPKHALATLQP